MSTPEERDLNTLRKLSSNKKCVNCDTVAKFGHSHICEKYHTFVCSLCKSAHQSFSMRVKSITMSNWTKAQVDELRDENGGGNDAGREKWLHHWTPSNRKPTKDDKLDDFKRFVEKVYIKKAFYKENDDNEKVKQVKKKKKDAGSPPKERKSTKTTTVNLLDFTEDPPTTRVADASGFADFSTGTSNFSDFADFSSAGNTNNATSSNALDNFADFSSNDTKHSMREQSPPSSNWNDHSMSSSNTGTSSGANSSTFADFTTNSSSSPLDDFADFSSAGYSTTSLGGGEARGFDPFSTVDMSSTLPEAAAPAPHWDAFASVDAPPSSTDPFSSSMVRPNKKTTATFDDLFDLQAESSQGHPSYAPTSQARSMNSLSNDHPAGNSPFTNNGFNDKIGGMMVMPSPSSTQMSGNVFQAGNAFQQCNGFPTTSCGANVRTQPPRHSNPMTGQHVDPFQNATNTVSNGHNHNTGTGNPFQNSPPKPTTQRPPSNGGNYDPFAGL